MHNTLHDSKYLRRKKFRTHFLGFLGFFCVLYGAAGNAQASAHAAWAEIKGQGVEIRYAHQVDQNWSEPQSLSGDSGTHVTPALASDQRGTVWVAWIERGAESYTLRFNTIDDGTVTASGTISTFGTRSFAPSILVDDTDTPWVAWSSFDGQDEDIYASYWDGSAWASPMRVHDNNDIPDSLPVLGQSDNGQIWVTWRTIQNNESRTLYSTLTGTVWSPPQVLTGTDITQDNATISQPDGVSAAVVSAVSSANNLPSMPAQAASRIMGVMTMPGTGPVQSMSDHIVPLRTGK